MTQSALVSDMKKCCVCENTQNIELHHIFFGHSKRHIADELGYVLPLCRYHHTQSKDCPHKSISKDLAYKKLAQIHFEENKGKRELFIELIGKSYL